MQSKPKSSSTIMYVVCGVCVCGSGCGRVGDMTVGNHMSMQVHGNFRSSVEHCNARIKSFDMLGQIYRGSFTVSFCVCSSCPDAYANFILQGAMAVVW